MRRIQSMRKDAGLQKQHVIELFIQTSKENFRILEMWRGAIKEKVGARRLEFSDEGPQRDYSASETAKIKEKEFAICFNKI
jgi:hypothetical protein